MKDPLGDIIKSYEKTWTNINVDNGMPFVVRLDGRCFSKFTAKMAKPVDSTFQLIMLETTRELIKEFNPEIGYTQSDEITLIFDTKIEDNPEYQHMFNGKVQKIASVIAGFATAVFNSNMPLEWKFDNPKYPHFDCRVFSVPDMSIANKALLWREQDAIRNAILSMGQHILGKKVCHGKKTLEIAALLIEEKDARPSDYGKQFEQGLYLSKVPVQIELTDEEWDAIPDKQKPKSRWVTRSKVEIVNYDPRLYEKEFN